MLRKKEAYFLFKRVLVSCLYVTFFFVQLCYNFDFSSAQKHSFDNNVYQKISDQPSQHHPLQIKKADASKKNIRLNKRFHPSDFPDFDFPDFDIITKYYTQISIGHNYQEALLNTITLTASFRGPPAIA